PAVLTSEAEPVSEVFFPDPYHRQGNHRIHSYEGHTSTENLFSGSFLSQLSGQREDEHSIWFSISSASYDPPAVKHFVTMHNGAFQIAFYLPCFWQKASGFYTGQTILQVLQLPLRLAVRIHGYRLKCDFSAS